ncbi:MAG: M28 family peptidase [Planctomycetota bacterium]
MQPTSKTTRGLALAALLLTESAVVAQSTEAIDEPAVQILRKHGLEQSQVMDLLGMICDVHGPRLTGSPNIRRAQAWARDTLEGFGLNDAHLASWGPFGRAWELEHFALHVVGENPWPVLAWPKAWSPGLDGRMEGEVIDALAVGAEALAEMDLSRTFVLIETPRELSEWFDGTAERFDSDALLSMANGASRPPRRSNGRPASPDFRAGFQKREAVMKVLAKNKPLAILDRSFKGDYGTIFVGGASASDPVTGERTRAYAPGAVTTPQFTLAVEHFNRISRNLARGIPTRLAVELRVRWNDDDAMEHNVIADLAGGDPALAEEVVMVGAHFDSWHSGTGCTDNGTGSAVMMEAMRLLTVLVKESGRRPRRTIRIGLWSGEEQGLLGSRAWVEQNLASGGGRTSPPKDLKPLHEKFAGYFNLDNGTGRIRGVYLQGNPSVRPIFAQWLKPFHDLDASTITDSDTGGTDHLSFDSAGLPGFQFIQDPVAYDTRTHHSNMDVWDHAVAEDLRQAATIVASFAWHAANRDEKLPRKPMRTR